MIRLYHRKRKIAFGFLAGLGILGAVFYPIVIDPFINPEKYRNVQRETRAEILRKNPQPASMHTWRNPFDPTATKKQEQQ